MISSAASEYRDLLQRCDRFDVWLADAGGRAGGAQYAELAALAYRQAIAAHKIIADEEGQVVFLSKEWFQQRLYRDGRRQLSVDAVIPAALSGTGARHAAAHFPFCGIAALAL